ncbi:hypothetical protein VTI74DRAFT_1707 [Chaetomium olivicolor]
MTDTPTSSAGTMPTTTDIKILVDRQQPTSMPKLQSIAPVFSTSNLTRWLDHYRALGFEVRRYGDEYGFASRDGIELHVSVNADHDPARTAGCAYVYVDDADALHALWSVVQGGRGPAPLDTDYGLREGGHIDPDGNLLRYGSPIRK